MIVRLTATLVAVVLSLASGMTAAPTAAAEPVVSVRSVSYPPGGLNLNVTVAVPTVIDEAARAGVAYSLRVQVNYVSEVGTIENFEWVTLLSDTTFICDIDDPFLICDVDADTVLVSVKVPIGTSAIPGGAPNYNASVELLQPETTPLALCQRTTEFVQSSNRYEALSPARQAKIDALADGLCAWLAAITPTLTPDQKATFVRIYKLGVNTLIRAGWLTVDQGALLRTLADEL